MDARYFEQIDADRVRCLLCPHRCAIPTGTSGICGVRKSSGGSIVLPYAGKISALALDPIEKKPLYHFSPGKKILSCGFVGCSFRCPFCQNFAISQSTLSSTKEYSPAGLVKETLDVGSFAIAYTYSEPTNHFEFVMETAYIARKNGLKNVLVSNGFLNAGPAEELCSMMNAANIDLKSFNPDFYRKELGGKLEPVLEFLAIAAERTHLEVTTLVIPGKNDSEAEIESIAKYIASLNDGIPLHLSGYHPTYKYTVPPTEAHWLFNRADIARKHLTYVYVGNAAGGSDTHCPTCGELLVRRNGYSVRIERFRNGRCEACGTSIPIVE